ncbi:MAG: branched-chain amino acid ABC transporter permease [Rhodospirillales bacterium]
MRPYISYMILGVALLAYPAFVNDFFVFQVGAYALILGTIALSLMLLAGYGGMVSLSQLTVAGVAGYTMAIFGDNNTEVMGLGWAWYVTIPLAIGVASIAGALIGAISVRTQGIYTIMITLAIAVSFFYFVRQNYEFFNGFTGLTGIRPPVIFGGNLLAPLAFYYISLVMAVGFFCAVLYGAKSTFGLTLQGVRDNPRRMQSLGYSVNRHKIFAHFLAGVIAGAAGVMLVWFNGRISPGSISVDVVINILIIAVIGGLRHPIGPFLGALAFVLLENFAIDLIDRDRFNMVIGTIFLLIVFFSPDGLLGFGEKICTFLRAKFKSNPRTQTASANH